MKIEIANHGIDCILIKAETDFERQYLSQLRGATAEADTNNIHNIPWLVLEKASVSKRIDKLNIKQNTQEEIDFLQDVVKLLPGYKITQNREPLLNKINSRISLLLENLSNT